MKTTFSILFTLLLIAAAPAQEETRAPREGRDPGAREARIEQMRQRLRARLDRLDAAQPRGEETGDAAPERPMRRARRGVEGDAEMPRSTPPWGARPDGVGEGPPAGPWQGMRRGERPFPGAQPPMAPEGRVESGRRARPDAIRPWQQFRDRFPQQGAPEGRPGSRPMAPPEGFGPRGFGPQGFGPRGLPPEGIGPGRFPRGLPEAGELPGRRGPGFEGPGAGRQQFQRFQQMPERALLRRMMVRRLQLQMRDDAPARRGGAFRAERDAGRRAGRGARRQEG